MKISGKNEVLEFLLSQPDNVQKVYIREDLNDSRSRKILNICRRHKIPFQLLESSHKRKPGVYLLARPGNMVDDARIIDKFLMEGHGILLVLDHIFDPHNLGAVIRNAVGFGASGVVLPQRNSAPITDTVFSASAGTASRIPLCYTSNLSGFLQKLKKLAIPIVGLSAHGSIPLNRWSPPDQVCVVVGGEDRGIRPGLRHYCSNFLSIPISNDVESLNLSVSVGIMLYAFRLGTEVK